MLSVQHFNNRNFGAIVSAISRVELHRNTLGPGRIFLCNVTDTQLHDNSVAVDGEKKTVTTVASSGPLVFSDGLE